MNSITNLVERCYDCVEFYYTCVGELASKTKSPGCADFRRLPDVMPGTTGQVVPPSRMAGRTTPHIKTGS